MIQNPSSMIQNPYTVQTNTYSVSSTTQQYKQTGQYIPPSQSSLSSINNPNIRPFIPPNPNITTTSSTVPNAQFILPTPSQQTPTYSNTMQTGNIGYQSTSINNNIGSGVNKGQQITSS